MKLTQRNHWKLLQEHYLKNSHVHLCDLFNSDANRSQQFSLESSGIFFDYSKNHITTETMDLFCKLANECQLELAIENLFSGKIVNHSEQRAALHTALRDKNFQYFKNEKIISEITHSSGLMREWVECIREGKFKTEDGMLFTDIIHVGMGGSHLGPAMAYEALNYPGKIRCHFVSTPDEEEISRLLLQLNPKKTLIMIVSKTFTTQETLMNAEYLKKWLINFSALPRAQMFAVTYEKERAEAFGIANDHIFPLWDWLGGRFSIWSPVSIALACSIGIENFDRFLEGAFAMDRHFRESPFSQNMPVILAFLSLYYVNCFGSTQHAVIPYSSALKFFPAYLQQLHMESLGKKVTQQGERLDYQTAPVIFGNVGPNTQHSFHQLLFQGSHFIPVDFILPLKKRYSNDGDFFSNKIMAANALAQAQMLMCGHDETHHREIKGNIPSNFLLLDEITPFVLGALIALYEHKIFVQSILWGINAFDQWGVECSKKTAKELTQDLDKRLISGKYDPSTKALLERILD